MNECIFCKIVHSEAPSWKVYEDENVVAFLDINPVNKYHTLVIPKIHYENIFDIPAEELLQVMAAIKKITTLFNHQLGINNVQIINCSGAEAQQDVFHLHFHIVPRHSGDQQNIRWKTHPEWRAQFDDMLLKLNQLSD